MRSSGAVACWGANTYAQATAPTGALYQAISAGQDHTCGLRADNAVVCWGRNDSGQLGDGTEENRFQPTQVGAGSAWLTASAGLGSGRQSLSAVKMVHCI